MRVLKAEFLKLRKSKVLLSFFILPIISAIFGTFNYMQNTEILTNGWYSLWTQHTLFLSYFFLPVLIGLICSYSFRIEQGCFNSFLSVPISRLQLLLGKFLICTLFSISALIVTAVFYLISGFYCGLEGVPFEILSWIIKGIFGVLAIVSVQTLFSLLIRNFAVPVGLSFIFGIFALILITVDLWFLSPYSLIAVGLNSNGSDVLNNSQNAVYIILSIIFILLGILISNVILSYRDSSNN